MGRLLKRVPLDFDYPLNEVWYGYYFRPNTCKGEKKCEACQKFAEIKGIKGTPWGCPDFEGITADFMKQLEPPKGEGYQLWEDTTEGSPFSPVFKTLDELCEWCAENATTFGIRKATKQEWKEMLETDTVHAQAGKVTYF